MADRWIIVTSTGDRLTLNPTFTAPQYEPGGVSTGAIVWRDDRSAYHRSGDGLATPGALRLTGRVWRDDRDLALMLEELDGIRDAVASCVAVERRTSRVMTRYESLAGGPAPEVTSDGLGGWIVVIELWPGRAESLTLPTITPTTRIAAYVDGTGGMDNDRASIVAALNLVRDRLDEEVYLGAIGSYWSVHHTPSTNQGERWLHYASQPTGDDVLVIAIFNDADPVYHAVPRNPSIEPTATFQADQAAWEQRVSEGIRRRCVLYGIAFKWAGNEDHYYAFKGHVWDAHAGNGAYPVALSSLGVETRLDAPTFRTPEWYAADLWRLIF